MNFIDLYSAFNHWFFNKEFWLASNRTWKDFENPPGGDTYIAQARDLWVIFPVAGVLFLVRLIFERFIAKPFGRYFGISEKSVKASSYPQLEAEYKNTPYPPEKTVQGLAKQLDLPERHIQRWFRKRRNQDRPTGMTKFTETMWRCFFYLVIFIYGLVVVTQKSYFYDLKDCWREHPHQHVPSDVYRYYVIELAFYISLLFSQFADVKRKDFWEQFVHHIATILLMWFSWCVNYVRVGALILCLHDACDYLLEGAKLARYINKRMLCDTLFGVFLVTWLITRLMIYPYFILHTTYVDAFDIAGYANSIMFLNVLLWVLQVLHVFWFVLIMKVAIKALTSGQVEKDVRSASEDSCDETVSSTSLNSERSMRNGQSINSH